MATWHLSIGSAAIVWTASVIVTHAQSTPAGDVWITPEQPYSYRERSIQIAPSEKVETPSGDVWLAPDHNAQAKAAQETEKGTDIVANEEPC
jgi:hypothetical protein